MMTFDEDKLFFLGDLLEQNICWPTWIQLGKKQVDVEQWSTIYAQDSSVIVIKNFSHFLAFSDA